jgi:hypothetical protein
MQLIDWPDRFVVGVEEIDFASEEALMRGSGCRLLGVFLAENCIG